MELMQISFEEPQLARLRQAAKDMDRPVSELVRAAVDAWLAAHTPTSAHVWASPPVYGLGDISANAAALRDCAWEDRLQP